MGKMRKAIEKARKQKKAKGPVQPAPAEGQESDSAASRALVGRTNFSKVLLDSDPPIIKHFRSHCSKRPMRAVKGPEELTAGNADSSVPFVVRKGRNILKLLLKDHDLKGDLEATLQAFDKKLEAGSDERSAFLGGLVWFVDLFCLWLV